MTYLYIMSNPAMPSTYKIGHTTNLANRLKDLFTTGVPKPFSIARFWNLGDKAPSFETLAHDALKEHRVHTNREFFSGDLGAIADSINNLLPQEVKCSSAKDYLNRGLNSKIYEEQFVCYSIGFQMGCFSSAFKLFDLVFKEKASSYGVFSAENLIVFAIEKCPEEILGDWLQYRANNAFHALRKSGRGQAAAELVLPFACQAFGEKFLLRVRNDYPSDFETRWLNYTWEFLRNHLDIFDEDSLFEISSYLKTQPKEHVESFLKKMLSEARSMDIDIFGHDHRMVGNFISRSLCTIKQFYEYEDDQTKEETDKVAS